MNDDPAPAAKPRPPFPAPRWEIFSWCMFDFANSSFTTAITSVIFALYFSNVVCHGRHDADNLWGIAIAISQGLVLLTAPVIGAISDFSGSKKKFLAVTWLGCCAGTAALWFTGQGAIALAMTIFIVANTFYSAGENITAAFLPELARPEDMGKISGYGWAWGYVGGLVSLALCIPFVKGTIGLENAHIVRNTNLVIAGFFFLAALPTMLFLRERKRKEAIPGGYGYLTYGWAQVFRTMRQVRQFKELTRFLAIFLVYNCGLTVVVYFASKFGDQTLHLETKELFLFFVLVQITSAIGAFVFGFVQDRWGARFTINITLILWTAVTVGCYFVQSKWWFYGLGNLAGLAIGASQSGARALVGVFSPPSRSGEFFGFWGLVWKLSSVIGPYVFGVVSTATGSQRVAILVTSGFFVVGFIGMLFVDEKAGRQAAIDAEKALASGNA